MLINLKNEDIEFDDKDLFLKDNIDYYDDFLVEDKIQDIEVTKENLNVLNKIRPVKPSAKTSFKPREKKSANLSKEENNNMLKIINVEKNSINTNKFQMNFNLKVKEGEKITSNNPNLGNY